jgi:Lrp/AsnC family transcriptional regulator for asnA, asnC and gidA
LIVLLNEDLGLLEFLTNEVSKIKDVYSTETFVVYKGFNLKVPYVL